jgi:hypothetical protein
MDAVVLFVHDLPNNEPIVARGPFVGKATLDLRCWRQGDRTRWGWRRTLFYLTAPA